MDILPNAIQIERITDDVFVVVPLPTEIFVTSPPAAGCDCGLIRSDNDRQRTSLRGDDRMRAAYISRRGGLRRCRGVQLNAPTVMITVNARTVVTTVNAHTALLNNQNAMHVVWHDHPFV